MGFLVQDGKGVTNVAEIQDEFASSSKQIFFVVFKEMYWRKLSEVVCNVYEALNRQEN